MSEATVDSMMGALQRLKDVRSLTFYFWAMGTVLTDHGYTPLTSGWLSAAVSNSCKRSDLNKPIRLYLPHMKSQPVPVIGSE